MEVALGYLLRWGPYWCYNDVSLHGVFALRQGDNNIESGFMRVNPRHTFYTHTLCIGNRQSDWKIRIFLQGHRSRKLPPRRVADWQGLCFCSSVGETSNHAFVGGISKTVCCTEGNLSQQWNHIIKGYMSVVLSLVQVLRSWHLSGLLIADICYTPWNDYSQWTARLVGWNSVKR